MLNLDTHILIYALCGELTAKERKLLSNEPWSISAIVLWEVCKLVQLRKVELDLTSHEVRQCLSNLLIWPITLEICQASIALDFRGDPADEIIAATSVVHHIPLVTRDRSIKGSKLVPLA